MDEEIKKQWVAALRSGEFKQTRGKLRRTEAVEDINSSYSYPAGHCCLGVLCELHARACGNRWDGDDYDKAKEVLPFSVADWAGLMTVTGITRYGNPLNPMPENNISLSFMNDHGRTFDEIARAIEEGM